MLVTGPQVTAEQRAHLVHPGPCNVGHEAGGRGKGDVDEPGRYLPGVHRLEPEPGRNRNHWQPGHLPHRHQDQVMELGGAQSGPWHAGFGHDALGGKFGPEVTKHRAINAAGDRDPVGPDDRDVHQVPHPDALCCADQVHGLVLVAFATPREVEDDLGSFHGGCDRLARGQVARHELDAFPGLAVAPGWPPYLAAGVPEPRDDEAPERAGAAGHEYSMLLIHGPADHSPRKQAWSASLTSIRGCRRPRVALVAVV